MLPTSKRKPFQIPHGLAAVAGGICLLLALVTDIQERTDWLSAHEGQSSRAVTMPLVETDEATTALARDRHQSDRQAPRPQDSSPNTNWSKGWLLLLRGFIPGGG